MNTRTEEWIDAALRRSPAQPIFGWRASRRLAVLAYHGVDDAERFAEHLDVIRRGASAVTLDDAVAGIEGRKELPRRAVLITFDDGHRSVLEAGLPLLRERGLPAAAFVVAELIGSDRPFWWSEVIALAQRGGRVSEITPSSPEDLVRVLKRVPDVRRREALDELRRTAREPAPAMAQLSADDLGTLESGGVAVGNHTLSHPCLSRCTGVVVRTEIEESHRMLTDLLGHQPTAFAYPDGDRDPRAVSVLRDLGYRAAFLFDHRLSPTRPRDPFAVSRLRVNSTTTLDRFRTISSGLHPTVHRARGGA